MCPQASAGSIMYFEYAVFKNSRDLIAQIPRALTTPSPFVLLNYGTKAFVDDVNYSSGVLWGMRSSISHAVNAPIRTRDQFSAWVAGFDVQKTLLNVVLEKMLHSLTVMCTKYNMRQNLQSGITTCWEGRRLVPITHQGVAKSTC